VCDIGLTCVCHCTCLILSLLVARQSWQFVRPSPRSSSSLKLCSVPLFSMSEKFTGLPQIPGFSFLLDTFHNPFWPSHFLPFFVFMHCSSKGNIMINLCMGRWSFKIHFTLESCILYELIWLTHCFLCGLDFLSIFVVLLSCCLICSQSKVSFCQISPYFHSSSLLEHIILWLTDLFF
jgi:hypothetical protein